MNTPTQHRMPALLAALTALVLVLIFGRNYFRGAFLTYPGMFFLLYNLGLAWIPCLAALKAERSEARGAALQTAFWLVLWLVFLPNAPYIITDLIHLKPRNPVPFWYDAVLFFTTALNGLLLGLFSIFTVQTILTRRFGSRRAWAAVGISIALSGFGIWLGRFLRWNSWDILTNPRGIAADLLHTLSQRSGLVHAAGFSAVLALLMLISYAFFWAAMDRREA